MLDYLYSPQPGSQLNEGAFIDKTFATHAQDIVSYSGKLSGHSASPQLRVDFPYRTTVHDDSFNSTDVQRNLFDEVARDDHYGLFDMNSNTCYFTPKKKSITQYVNNMESYTPSKIIGPEHGYVEQDQMDLNDYSPSPTLSSSSYSSQDEPGHGRDVNVDPFSFTFSGLNNGRSSLAAHISSKFDDIVVHHTNTIDNATFGSSSKDRYKTELCRSWAETGYCRYGEKCQFAHGQPELRQVSRHHKYKSELCNNYHYEGTCMYGTRCCFIHSVDKAVIGRAISQNIDVVPLQQMTRPSSLFYCNHGHLEEQ